MKIENPFHDLTQFKLSNGSEIICEVIEWPSEDDKEDQLIIRNALTILNVEYDDGEKGYIFRPWIHFMEEGKEYVLLNNNHIISINRPSEYLIDQYHSSLMDYQESAERRAANHKREKLEGMQRIANAMQKVVENRMKRADSDEEETLNEILNNVIPFIRKDDDKVH